MRFGRVDGARLLEPDGDRWSDLLEPTGGKGMNLLESGVDPAGNLLGRGGAEDGERQRWHGYKKQD